jgi:hypothetical protein
MMMTKIPKPFAEVIESSLQGFLAQSWQWDQFPSYGSLMTIHHSSRTVYGIVYQVQTGSMDPVRYPFPYQKTEEELRKEQPQIFEFLKTTFSCLTIGYAEKGRLHHLLAPEPPKIHAFIIPASSEQCKDFFVQHHYLPLIFNFAHLVGNVDELLLALLKQQEMLKDTSSTKLNSFMQQYAFLIGNDYRRIKLFAQRVASLA